MTVSATQGLDFKARGQKDVHSTTGLGQKSSRKPSLDNFRKPSLAVTVTCNGYSYGSHAAYVCQGYQAACLARIVSIEWRLVYSFAAVFTDLSLRPETVPTASVASFDYD